MAGPQSGRLCFFLVEDHVGIAKRCRELWGRPLVRGADPPTAVQLGPFRSHCVLDAWLFVLLWRQTKNGPSTQALRPLADQSSVIQYPLLFDVIRYYGLLLAFESEYGIILCLIFLP